MSWEQRNADFYKAQTDAQMAYIEAEREVKQLRDENAKLCEELAFEKSENGWAREFLNRMAVHCGTKDCPSLVAYVGKLRELCNDMWSVMSCEYASDAMADACRDTLGCDMNEVERRVNELCKEES